MKGISFFDKVVKKYVAPKYVSTLVNDFMKVVTVMKKNN